MTVSLTRLKSQSVMRLHVELRVYNGYAVIYHN